MLPDYIAKAVPNPPSNRGPWYANTAPSYAGIFLWIAFYLSIAKDTLPHAGLGLCIAAIVVAGLLSYALYYYAPGDAGHARPAFRSTWSAVRPSARRAAT